MNLITEVVTTVSLSGERTFIKFYKEGVSVTDIELDKNCVEQLAQDLNIVRELWSVRLLSKTERGIDL